MIDSVLVGTVRYRVSVDPEEWLKMEHRSERKDRVGVCDNYRGVIQIDPDSDPGSWPLTLLHEIMHALNWTVMGDRNWKRELRGLGKDKAEELTIRAWEAPLLGVLQDNPRLIDYLMGVE